MNKETIKTIKNRVILASSNLGKIKELKALLENLPIDIISQQELGINSCHEHGLTFVENAILKARHACHYSNLPAIADDSGLAVEALNGAPGIFSARYAFPNASDSDNINKLLQDLRDVPKEKRAAYFYCTIVYLHHENDPAPIICQGKWQGEILNAPKGSNGFGYDPIFWVKEYNCSAAELSLEIKNKISHRAQALQQFIQLAKNGELLKPDSRN